MRLRPRWSACTARHFTRCVKRFLHGGLLLSGCLLGLGHSVVAQEPSEMPSTLQDLTDNSYINSLLLDQEFPVLGGRWGWEMFIDVPLNAEPEGAQTTLRRAKASYKRRLTENWRLNLNADYSRGGDLELSDNTLSYSGWDRALLTMGISDPAFSLESVSQSSALTFMERALPVVALAEAKSGNIGILKRGQNDIFQGALILFNVSRDNLRSDGEGVVLHYVRSPVILGLSNNLHWGGSFSHRWNASGDGTQFRSRPEVATINDYFVDSGSISNAERVSRLSLEASQVRGRFSWQTEILGARVHRKDTASADFWGAYGFVSWFLTKDSRNYNFGTGSFERVSVGSPLLKGGMGAFELALRASLADLTDKDIVGGREKNLSLGLNWYANRRLRLMTNLVKVVDLKRPGSEFDGEDPLILSLRLQWVLH